MNDGLDCVTVFDRWICLCQSSRRSYVQAGRQPLHCFSQDGQRKYACPSALLMLRHVLAVLEVLFEQIESWLGSRVDVAVMTGTSDGIPLISASFFALAVCETNDPINLFCVRNVIDGAGNGGIVPSPSGRYGLQGCENTIGHLETIQRYEMKEELESCDAAVPLLDD